MKSTFLLVLLITFTMNLFAQKGTFDVVSFNAPKGWQQQQNEGGMQVSVTDKKTGAYALAIVTKATASEATPTENFNTDWTRLIKSTVQVTGEPVMQDPRQENGWDIVRGYANYTDGPNKGVATLLTATGGGQMVSVILMTNTQQYQDELLGFINSLELVPVTSTATNTNNSSIVGLWAFYNTETSGYSNGFPLVTGGYMRREYVFYADGTYLFREKIWMVYVTDILFAYETGTYSIKGNQLIITPKKGKGEWWSKINSDTKAWGKFVRASSDYKSETVTYNFEFKYYSGSKENVLLLRSAKPTVREGKANDTPGLQEFYYSAREMGKSLIDNPPGFKTGFENKPLNAAASSAINNSPLAGKIWEGTTMEKFSNAGGASYNTGGFSTHQYRFNTDGTYRFVAINASHFTDTKSLEYETGTYTINGNQLSIIPAKGYNQEWSKVGKTSNANSNVTNRAINETWGKKLKTSGRKLEQVTYTFNIGKNGDRTALVLQYSNGHTEREGNGNQTYLNETSPEKSAKLPAAIK